MRSLRRRQPLAPKSGEFTRPLLLLLLLLLLLGLIL